jgi:methionine salvage enolase-phosphatase E1
LKENWGKPELMITIDRLRENCSRESTKSPMPVISDASDPNQENVLKSVVANVLWQMEERRRNTALKQLQLLVWVYGYEKGHLQGQ